MTREEAKRTMFFAQREVFPDSYIYKAYDVAIKALEEPERKIGHWDYNTSFCGSIKFIHRKCSECRYESMGMGTKYCPDCGARMVDENEIN